jgi:hypothetical protein
MSFRALRALAVGLAASCLLLWNTAALKADTDYADLGAFRRLWSDLAFAINGYLETQAPVPRDPTTTSSPAETVERYRRIMIERTRERGIRPTQFWRTLRGRAFLREWGPLEPGAYDDPGRALLLALAFRQLEGISPFLILWLGAVFCIPVLLWTSWEFFMADQPVAGTTFVLGLVSSPYVVEVLALPRYAVGFYALALLLLVPLSVYALLGASPSPKGLVIRAALAGLGFAVCALSRSSSLLLSGGFLLALFLGFCRVKPRERWRLRSLAASLAVLLLFLSPYLATSRPQRHDVWQPLWEGLGDFDRTKGHAWSDPVAEEVVTKAGGQALWTPRSEAIFRTLVLNEVREDPVWYATILAKRACATIAQWKLWPWAPRDGIHIRRRSSDNEGFIDKYYGYTTTVDHLGFGSSLVELPIALLFLPTLLLVALVCVPTRFRPGATDAGLRPARLAVIGCMGLAAIPLPVLITTAGAQETQAFALVYLLGLSFLVEEIKRSCRRPEQERLSRASSATCGRPSS